jgi:hypothetical protein
VVAESFEDGDGAAAAVVGVDAVEEVVAADVVVGPASARDPYRTNSTGALTTVPRVASAALR